MMKLKVTQGRSIKLTNISAYFNVCTKRSFHPNRVSKLFGFPFYSSHMNLSGLQRLSQINFVASYDEPWIIKSLLTIHG